MKDDGFSYPKKQYNTPYRKCYVYTCHICGLEIKPYYQKRVKGKITCSRCKNKFKGVERMTLKCIGSGSSERK